MPIVTSTANVTVPMAQAMEVEAVETPASLRAALAARKPEVSLNVPKDFLRSMRVRNQLLLAYGLLAMLAFGVLIGICTTLTTVVSNTVVDVSRQELTSQVVNNSLATLQETALVLDARLSEGFDVLVGPSTFAIFDLIGGDSSLLDLPSYAETTTASLKPPLSYDARWHCQSTANDASTGCNAVTRLQQLSLGASSVYVTGSSTSGDGFETADAATWAQINRTSVVDTLVKEAWKERSAWLDVYLAGFSSTTPLLRQYPGAVGSLEVAAGTTTRSYDPTTKGWYKQVVDGAKYPARTTNVYLAKRNMIISAPYVSDFGRGYLVSVSAAVVGPSGVAEGVIGADIAVSSLQSIVTTIKSRETGEAHFFARGSGLVVASRQLDAAYTISTIPHIDSLKLPGEANKHILANLDDGDGKGKSLLADSGFVFDAKGGGHMTRTDPDGKVYQLVWQLAWQGSFVLLTITPMEEIQRPIQSQLAQIRSYGNSTLAIVVLICLGCLLVIVLMVIVMARKIAAPIADTVKQSNMCVRNIGSNLFDGIKIDGAPTGQKPSFAEGNSPVAGLLLQTPGEVAALRGQFLRALFMLNKKRVRMPAAKTPFGGHALPPSTPDTTAVQAIENPAYAAIARSVQQEPGEDTRRNMQEALAPPQVQPLTYWNRTVCKIGGLLLFPIFLAMAVVVGIITSWIASGVISWLAPVKTTMVNEELSNLNVRAYERALFTASYINSAAGSLTVLHDFASSLASDSIPISTPRVSYLSPTGAHCTALDTTGAPSYFSCTKLALSTGPRPPTTKNNYQATAVYKPSTALPTATRSKIEGSLAATSVEEGSGEGYDVTAVSAAWAKEQLLMSQLDQIMSAVFFASDITYAYVGFHNSEVYRQFPYMDLSSFITGSGRTCDAVPSQKLTGFTPVCRAWYANALKSTTTTYNSVNNDAANPGTMFLSLSRRIDVGGSLVGVAAVDVGLAELADSLNITKLYKRGFAMVWDADGLGVVHKNYKRDQYLNKGPLPIQKLDAVGDAPFEQKWKENCLDKGRVIGNWSAVWQTPSGGSERWFYSFRPVPDTPYMIALTVVEQEVTEIPDNAQSRQLANVWAALGVSIVICSIVMALLFVFTMWLNKRFARPIMKLVRLVEGWGDKKLKGNIDAEDAEQSSSQELSVLLQNFKKMLIALRFGDSGWTAGQGQRSVRQMDNYLSACELVQSTGNARGMGIVLNNVALATADPSIEKVFPQLEVAELWPAAIAAAKQQVDAHPDDVALRDTLAMRLLNCTLWHMNAEPPRPEEAAAVLSQVVINCTNVRTMSTVAAHVSSHILASGGLSNDGAMVQPHPMILGAVSTLVGAALSICAQASLPFDDSDLVADLAVAHCDVGCTTMFVLPSGEALPTVFCQPPQLAMWALTTVPTISERTLHRLCLHAKAGADQTTTAFIDTVAGLKEGRNVALQGTVPLGAAVAEWRKASNAGKALAKAMMFVMDLSYSMDSERRLITCKQALQNILTSNIDADDRCGLISFADDVRMEFPLMLAGAVGGDASSKMLGTVKALRTRGMTAFYSAILTAAKDIEEKLASEPNTPKWLVALTDGADNKSVGIHRSLIPAVLASIPNLNLALITVGDDVDLRTCQKFLDAVTEAGNTSMLVKANNAASIMAAFENVAEAMSAGVAEVL